MQARELPSFLLSMAGRKERGSRRQNLAQKLLCSTYVCSYRRARRFARFTDHLNLICTRNYTLCNYERSFLFVSTYVYGTADRAARYVHANRWPSLAGSAKTKPQRGVAVDRKSSQLICKVVAQAPNCSVLYWRCRLFDTCRLFRPIKGCLCLNRLIYS